MDGNTTQEAVTEIIGRACARINQYAPIVDTMIQHNPFMTSLVWGSVKAVLKVCSISLELSFDSQFVGTLHHDHYHAVAR